MSIPWGCHASDALVYPICRTDVVAQNETTSHSFDIVILLLLNGCASERLFDNLIENALSYTSSSVLISVHLSMCDRLEEWHRMRHSRHCDNARVTVSSSHLHVERACGSIMGAMFHAFEHALSKSSSLRHVVVQFGDMWWFRHGLETVVRQNRSYLPDPYCFTQKGLPSNKAFEDAQACASVSQNTVLEYQEGSFYSVNDFQRIVHLVRGCETSHSVSEWAGWVEEIMMPSLLVKVRNDSCDTRTFADHVAHQLAHRYTGTSFWPNRLHHSAKARSELMEGVFAIKSCRVDFEQGPDDTYAASIAGLWVCFLLVGTLVVLCAAWRAWNFVRKRLQGAYKRYDSTMEAA